MPSQTSIFQKPLVKIISLTFAFFVLTVSILLSQSKAEKDEKRIKPPTIFNSSKSISPKLHKKENPKSENEQKQIQEQPELNKKDDSNVKEQKNESKETKVENKPKKNKEKSNVIMPSSKAPDPGNLLQP